MTNEQFEELLRTLTKAIDRGNPSPSNNSIWMRSVWAIRELGVTTFVILVLLGVMVGYLGSPMTETRNMMKTHLDTEATSEVRQATLLGELVKTQRATCVNQAKDDEGRRRCLQ